MNQTGVSEIHFAVAILAEQTLQRSGSLRQLKWNLKHTGSDVLQDRFRGSGQPAEKIATLGDHRFTSDKRRGSLLDRLGASGMFLFATIQESYNHPGIQ